MWRSIFLLVFFLPFFLSAQNTQPVKPKPADQPAPPADEVVLEPAPSDDATKEKEQKRREERKKEREEERKKKQKKSGKGKCKV